MKRIVLLMMLWSIAVGVSAQRTEEFVRKLALPDSTYRSQIIVTEKGEAAAIVRMLQASRVEEKLNGFRVRIFFDNSQSAKSNAMATMERFQEEFPDTPVYIDYKNPDWKVTVGNCLSVEEAIILWGRVKGSFDLAFITREEISMEALTE